MELAALPELWLALLPCLAGPGYLQVVQEQ
jgi:hypothetical protein